MIVSYTEYFLSRMCFLGVVFIFFGGEEYLNTYERNQYTDGKANNSKKHKKTFRANIFILEEL
jgi:hypothetical protein